MSPLLERIASVIRLDGPMSVSTYMTLCLHDPRHGYYATRPGIGHDFATAPEISQVFGELLGAWAVQEWRAMGSPERVWLLELGPGTGAMMADMLRVARRDPGFSAALRLVFAEASPALRTRLSERFGAMEPLFVDDVAALPDGPVLIIANEYLDCLPIRQAVRTETGWRERCVGLGDNTALTWGVGLPIDLPADLQPSGEAVEFAPALATLVRQLALRFRNGDGRALFVDYGPAHTTPSDTLRAYLQGRQTDPLEAPGECDLTADVDFGRLAQLARAAGLAVFGPISQGDFLLQLGAAPRAEALASANPDRADALLADVRRLVDPTDMGARFHAIAIAPAGAPAPPGFEGTAR